MSSQLERQLAQVLYLVEQLTHTVSRIEAKQGRILEPTVSRIEANQQVLLNAIERS